MKPRDDSAPLDSGVQEALAKNEEVAEEVRQASEQLAVVHAVLDTSLDGVAGPPTEDVAQAIDRALVLEKSLAESAEKLDEVNAALGVLKTD